MVDITIHVMVWSVVLTLRVRMRSVADFSRIIVTTTSLRFITTERDDYKPIS
jgi:hypothetical protein